MLAKSYGAPLVLSSDSEIKALLNVCYVPDIALEVGGWRLEVGG